MNIKLRTNAGRKLPYEWEPKFKLVFDKLDIRGGKLVGDDDNDDDVQLVPCEKKEIETIEVDDGTEQIR